MISEYTNRLNVGRSLLEEVAKVLICKETVLLLFCFFFAMFCVTFVERKPTDNYGFKK